MESLQSQSLNSSCTRITLQVDTGVDTYKPKVPYVEGSYSLLVQHFYDFWDGTLCDNIEEADVIVKVHESDDLSDVESLKESKIIFDPWRTHKSDKHKVYQYGNRRSTYDENPFFE